MECKKSRAAAFVFLLFSVFAGNLVAQKDDGGEKNYYISKDENNNIKFVQKLSWNKIQDIKNYRITIEREIDGAWNEILVKDLLENKIEVSLEPGLYRFQVSVINLFDKLEKSSDWQRFEVLKALQPKIDGMQSDSLFLNSKKADGIFLIEGENLSQATVFTMEKKDSEPPKILRGKILSVEPDGSRAQVQFDMEEIDEGKYEIYAQNPGGLSVISKTISIKKKKDRSWRLLASAGYTLPFTFYDGTLDHYTVNKFYPISACGKITLMAFHSKICDIGFGAAANYSLLTADTKSYKFIGNLLTVGGTITLQKYIIPQKLCLDVHALAGVGMIFGGSFENKFTGQKSPALNSAAIAFGGGLGIQCHFGKRLYAEGSVDFIHAKFKDMDLGLLYPSVSVGGMF